MRKLDPERGLRIRLAAAGVPLVLGLAIFLSRESISDTFYISVPAATVVGLFLVGLGGSFLLMLYLRGEINAEFLDKLTVTGDRQLADSSQLRRELGAVRADVAQLAASVGQPEAVLSEEEKQELFVTLKSDVTVDLEKRLLDELEEKYSQAAKERAHLTQIRELLNESSSRLGLEIAALARRGNVNLVIGVITTVAAVGLLVYMVTGIEAGFDSVYRLLSYYIPRITVVVFIEVFSFFFLRLYRSTLAEIKYYQNELTTLGVLASSLEAAMLGGDQKVLSSVAEVLARTDRNRIAGVGEIGFEGGKPTLEMSEVAKLLANVGKLMEKTVVKTAGGEK